MKNITEMFVERFGPRPKKDLDEQMKWEAMHHGFKTALDMLTSGIKADITDLNSRLDLINKTTIPAKLFTILQKTVVDWECTVGINGLLKVYDEFTSQQKIAAKIKPKSMTNKETYLNPMSYYLVNFFKRNPTGTQKEIANQMNISHRSLRNYIRKLEKQNIINRKFGEKNQTTYSVNPKKEWTIQ